MSAERFDQLCKILATGTSRRQVLKGMAAAVAGGLVAAIAGREAPVASAQPACSPLGQNCKDAGSLSNCCATTSGGAPSNLVCTFVGQTGARRCECATGFESCGGTCFAVCPTGQVRNPANCSCGCPSGSQACTPTGSTTSTCVGLCTGGTELNANCQCVCPQGQTLCSGTCVTNCSGGKVLNGSCQCVCPGGTETCTPTGGAEQCFTLCSGGQSRVPGTCGCACPQGQELCTPTGGNPTCTTTCTGGQVFNANCQCVCPGGQELVNGQCVAECPTGKVRNAAGQCVCPQGTETCDNGQCFSGTCGSNLVFNPATCSCGCPANTTPCIPQGSTTTFCVSTTCTRRNQVFNVGCCSCENPGQQSGQCKNSPGTV